MKLIQIYQCLCDETRLRILHLLSHSPLCVCHFQSVLLEPQVKISKHLFYLRKHGLVEVRRHRNWRIYHLPLNQPPLLQRHLQCLQDCIRENRLFGEDLARWKQRKGEVEGVLACGGPVNMEGGCCD